MTFKNLNNISIPNQSVFDSSTDAGFVKLQNVASRLYTASNKIAYKDEYSDAEELDPVYTYTSGVLTRVDYASGNYKVFTYNLSGVLTQLDFIKSTVTYRKVFTYDLSSNLTSVDYSII